MGYRSRYRSRKSGWDFKTIIGLLVILAVVLLVIIAVFIKPLGGINYKYSEGHRSGTVYKFSKKGFIWKTWEGELSLDLTERDDNGNLVNKIFHFSCSSDEVAKEITAAASSGKRVTLHYQQYKIRGYKYGATEYDILRVEYPKEDGEGEDG